MAVPISAKSLCDEVTSVKAHAPAADTLATVTLPVEIGQFAVIWRIWAGFDTAAAAVETLACTNIRGDDLAVSMASAGIVELNGPLYGEVGVDPVVSLSADSAGASGSVNVLYSLHPAHQQT